MTDGSVRSRIVDILWNGRLDVSAFPSGRFRRDLQGWNSHHEYLSEAIEMMRPQIVVEIGVWKGGSTIHMAEQMQRIGLDAVVVAVDTWLGSWEHWEQPDFFADLLFDYGYPTLYYTFLANLAESGMAEFVVPLPLDSANAAIVFERKALRADVVHIDGGHDFEAVLADMHRWWPVLRPGGLVIMDDYDTSGAVWPSVRDAVDRFRETVPHENFEARPYKARLMKPL